MNSHPKILIATDGSEHARHACEVVKSLPLPSGTEAIVLAVRPTADEADHEHTAIAAEADRIVTAEAARLEEFGWQASTLVREGDAAEQIIDTAQQEGADLISLGAHGTTGLTHFLLGGIAQKVVHHAPCSVLVARMRDGDDPLRKPLRVLLAVDGSEPAEEAAGLVSSWVNRDRAEVIVVGVLSVATTLYGMDIVERTAPSWLKRKQELQEILDATAEHVKQSGAATSVILREGGSDPSQEILATAASEDIDLIVVGHTGRSGLQRFLLGSVAHRIVNHASCSVLVVRP